MRTRLVLLGGIGGALLGGVALAVYVNGVPALLNDGFTALLFAPVILLGGAIGVVLAVLVGLFLKKS